MKQILSNKSISVEETWVQYREVLQRYLRVVQKPTTPAKNHQVVEEESDDDDDIVTTFPQVCLRKARSLLRKLKQNQNIHWDACGNVNIYGKFIPGANIVDLISVSKIKYTLKIYR